MVGELLRPVAAVLAQRHLLRHPVDLLLALPELESPGIFKRLVGAGGLEKRHEGLLGSFWPRSRGDAAYGRMLCQSGRSEEHTSELQSLMRISYADFCLQNKNTSLTTT